MKKSISGFTIVELLIVVVIIAILAAISVVAYTNIQNRALDSRRIDDLRSITRALELHKTDTGYYPATSTSGLGAQDGWEASAREDEHEFIAPLKAYGFASGVPVDPINNATGAVQSTERSTGKYTYVYYRYPAGANGCDASRGRFYVLGAINMATTGTGKHPDSPGFSCPGYSWGSFSWVAGGFEN